ncbi:hypothetical protein [uncultured Shewanella sp.]|uniref:hypothetical protein n=1 Tax=uncultured Shewanella sp. TaxID=173975 RepID=UPI00263238FE|nr:hypothetical protein [uncultured Shewanella sp.]
MTMGSKAATKLLSAGLNKFEFGKKVTAAFEDVINQIEQGTFKHPKLGWDKGSSGHSNNKGEVKDSGKNSLGFTKLSSDARKYLDDLEQQTDFSVNAEQRGHLADALREKEFTKISTHAAKKHRREFNTAKNKLISEWEKNTGQIWPRYTENLMSKDGTKINRKAGQPYDAHHIIESSYGGPNEWWNMHPARFPDQHQGGIHRKDGIIREIFPR